MNLSLFPGLAAAEHRVASPTSDKYNCVAWAALDENRWWWPDAAGVSYWPPQAPREETLEAFVEAYRLLGYLPCDSADLETGFHKIAIYAREGLPTHAARQLPDGRWASKLGRAEDIEHATLAALEGRLYGRLAIVLRRRNAGG
jgi:hypothetical protein